MALAEFSDRYPTLVKRLRAARRRGRIAHAYLLAADRIDLLQQFVDAWLPVFLCLDPNSDGDACGECGQCLALNDGTYPHLHVVRARSKSRQITIADIRNLEHTLHLSTGEAIKVGLIVDAERLNESAQNAFLKTLEEPTPGTLLMLLSSRPGELLPTIRSRCQLISLYANQYQPNLPEQQRVFRALSMLQPRAGAGVAAQAASELHDVLKGLKATAEAHGKARQKSLPVTADTDAQLRKRLEEELAAATASEYLALRDELLASIYTWFGQEYVRAHGIDEALFANADIYSADANGVDATAAASEPDARRSLALAEELLRNLRYNVDEQLAILEFCQQICIR